MSAAEAPPKRVLVTGGNAGIGFALCRQLATEEGCSVLLGARDPDRGREAVASIRRGLSPHEPGSVELVVIDVTSDESVSRAAEGLTAPVYAVVNNAGTGLAHGASPETVLQTNLYGPRRVVEALIAADRLSERVVNVGSGSGPSYVERCPIEAQPALCRTPESWAALESMLALGWNGRTGLDSEADVNGGYGISKALLSLYTMLLARERPDLTVSCCSPGWIRTRLVGHDGPSKGPEEGTVSLKHCLFEPLEASGWYYGSDALRSPLHYMRSPGESPWDGVVEGVVGVPASRRGPGSD